MKRKICIVTGSRAEYGSLYWLIKELSNDKHLALQLVVTGMHLSTEFGLTYKEIEKDGFAIDHKVAIPLENDTVIDITKAVGAGIAGFADAFFRLKPDVVVVLGDRFEIFAAATAATIAKIPIAHIHGGESTEGAIDEAFRHAITKMAFLHFTAAEPYRRRIIQMGESPDRVFCVGAPGLEHIKRTPLLSKEELESSLEFKFGNPTFLVTYHPVTLDSAKSESMISELMKALDTFPKARIIFTQSNADPDNVSIRTVIEGKAAEQGGRIAMFTTLGHRRYFSVLQYVDVVIGNSSSGIVEAPAFRKPTVNIGDRQRGRLMAGSIINCGGHAEDIASAIEKALSPEFKSRIVSIDGFYMSGDTSTMITNILRDFPLEKDCLKKKFYDLDPDKIQ